MLFFSMFGLGGCRSTPPSTTNYSVTVNDSLYWKKISGDSLIKIPGSYVPLVILPDKMKVGEEKKEKKGQATVTAKKEEDGSILITANCDSMEVVIHILTEELTKVSKQNEELKQQVKASPNKWNWFTSGFFIGLILIGLISYKVKK